MYFADLATIFYPSSPTKAADGAQGAARFAEIYSISLTLNDILQFADFIIENTLTKPKDVDSLIQSARLISRDDSLPLVFWSTDRPKATFNDVFNTNFCEEIHSNLNITEPSERLQFLNASFIAGRARSLDLTTSLEINGAVGEGLKLPGDVIHHSTGKIAEIRALGSWLQLLGSASSLIAFVGDRFAPEKLIESLENVVFNPTDKPLVDLTIQHLTTTPLRDLTSQEIVQRV